MATSSRIFQWLFFGALLICSGFIFSGWGPAHAQQAPSSTPGADRFLNILGSLGKKEYDRALSDSEALIIVDPAFPLVYEKLVDAAKRGGDLDRARVFFTSQAATNPRGHFGLGLIQRERGELAESIEEFRQCLQQLPDFVPAYIAFVNAARALNLLPDVGPFIESLPRTAASRYGLSHLRYTERRYQEAIELGEQALSLDPRLSEAYKTRAQSLYALGRYADARQAAQTLIQQVTEPEKIELRLSASLLAAVATAVIGNRAEGIAELNSAYRGIVAVGNLELEESVHSQLAYLYDLQKDCVQSLQHAKAALALGNELQSRYVGRYIGNVGGAYACLGDMTEAISYYNQALEFSAEPRNLDSGNLVSLLTNIAEANISNSAEALPMLERALTVSRTITNRTMEMRVLLVLGALDQQNGDYARALERTKAALQIAQQTGVVVPEGNAWVQMGSIHFVMSDNLRAMDAYQQALAIGERTNTPSVIWQALAGLAAVYERQGKVEQAEKHYRQAIETIEDVRRRIGISEDRASFFADKVRIYERLINLLVTSRSKQPTAAAEAFHYVERARARAFLDLLAEARVDVEQKATPDLMKRQQELQQRISQLTTQLIKERSQQTIKQDKTKIAESENGLKQADIELADWLRELRRRDPRYAALKYPEPITLAGVQRLLDDQTILLSYSLAEPHSFLFAITRDDVQVRRLPSEATLREGVQKLLAAITDKNNPDPAEYRRQATRLSQQLLQPISAMLTGRKDLVVVADGALLRLPFEALFLPGAPAQGDLRKLPFLIRRCAISYAPSASVWAELVNEQRASAPRGLIAFGDPIYDQRAEGAIVSTLRGGGSGWVNLQPLPHSRDEISGIAKLFAEDDRAVFFAEDASEENVKAPETLSHYRMVHFSTHGYVNETRPRFSGLLLSSPRTIRQNNQPPEDGLLSAYEIFNLKLHADLVVLSACETGLGKEIKGEGLMSLMRAFMYAGTTSVVVSLWNVNDESAADLMIRFYRNLKTGMSKREALRQAQLETIQDNGFPFFWAPFILIGKS